MLRGIQQTHTSVDIFAGIFNSLKLLTQCLHHLLISTDGSEIKKFVSRGSRTRVFSLEPE